MSLAWRLANTRDRLRHLVSYRELFQGRAFSLSNDANEAFRHAASVFDMTITSRLFGRAVLPTSETR